MKPEQFLDIKERLKASCAICKRALAEENFLPKDHPCRSIARERILAAGKLLKKQPVSVDDYRTLKNLASDLEGSAEALTAQAARMAEFSSSRGSVVFCPHSMKIFKYMGSLSHVLSPSTNPYSDRLVKVSTVSNQAHWMCCKLRNILSHVKTARVIGRARWHYKQELPCRGDENPRQMTEEIQKFIEKNSISLNVKKYY